MDMGMMHDWHRHASASDHDHGDRHSGSDTTAVMKDL